MKREVVLVAHNLRSCHNVGSILRTAEGLGVNKVWLTGYTPYPLGPDDPRLPHLARKLDSQITKTALGAEKLVAWSHFEDIKVLIKKLRSDGYEVAALEQTPAARNLTKFKPPARLVLIVGREEKGLEPDVLELCDYHLEIPMLGAKESFNVVQAAAMAVYHCRFG